MFSISKTFEFEASHRLILDYDSPCEKLHGHSYKVEISVATERLDKNGMVIDFSHLNQVKDWVNENWDHALLISSDDPAVNELKDLEIAKLYIFDQYNVTAENMTATLCKILNKIVDEKIDYQDLKLRQVRVRIWETSSNMAEYSENY